MKRFLLLVILALTALHAEAQVRFEKGSTDRIRNRAVAEQKLVFIDLYATWCGPCRQMDRQVFSQKEVGIFFDRHFVAAKYDVDQPTGAELMQRYGRGAIPLYLVFATDGRLLGRIEGARSGKQLMLDLQKIMEAARSETTSNAADE